MLPIHFKIIWWHLGGPRKMKWYIVYIYFINIHIFFNCHIVYKQIFFTYNVPFRRHPKPPCFISFWLFLCQPFYCRIGTWKKIFDFWHLKSNISRTRTNRFHSLRLLKMALDICTKICREKSLPFYYSIFFWFRAYIMRITHNHWTINRCNFIWECSTWY